MGTAVTLESTVIGPRSISDCQVPLAAVDLGLAAPFAILATTAVTDAGGSQINGDMGTTGTTLPVYPPYVPGTPGLNGNLHNKDATAQNARLAATVAWSDIKGRCNCETALLGSTVELGGRTLTPGLYTSSGSFHSEYDRALHLRLARI